MNLKKCIFGVQILPFAGFNSSNKSIFPDSYKMNAVTNVNVTKLCWTTRDAAKFNKKNTKFKYADKYQKTFEKLKVILTNSETKTYFISDGKTKVIAEA